MKQANSFKNSLTLIVAVAGGLSLCLAQSALAGSLDAWGSNIYKQCSNIPGGAQKIDDVWYSDNNDFVAVAGGAQHSLTLKADGSLAAWGKNDYGECNVPAGTDFVAVAGGANHSLALKTDGSIAAWGWNDSNRCSDIPGGANEVNNVWYSNTSDFNAISAGGDYSLAIKDEDGDGWGVLAAWGKNDFGQCNVPPDGNYFVVVDAGYTGHSLAIEDEDGDGWGPVVAWGRDDFGQCSNIPGGAHEINDVWYSDCNDFVAVAAGAYHSLALKDEDGDGYGSLAAWGRNNEGQCNVPDGNDYFVAVAGGDWWSLALKADGSLVAWGNNNWDQLNVPDGNDFVAIAVGGDHGLAIWECQYILVGDLNGDCRINFLDFAKMAANWLIHCHINPNDPACVPK